MSVASQCQECCTCNDSVAVEWDSVSGSRTKPSGMIDPATGKMYLSKTVISTYTNTNDNGHCPPSSENCATYCATTNQHETSTTTTTYNPTTGTTSSTYSSSGTCSSTQGIDTWCNGVNITDNVSGTMLNGIWTGTRVYTRTDNNHPGDPDYNFTNTYPAPEGCPAIGTGTTTSTTTYSDEYTTDDFKEGLIDNLPAFDNSWTDTEGSYANLSSDGKTYSVRQSRYRLRFKLSKVRSGTCFRAKWVERFIPEAGTSISSVSVHSPGVYRPTVSFSTFSGITSTAQGVAVMNADGSLSAINILTFGDYRPKATISGGGGSGASVIVDTLNPSTGGVDTVIITPGSGYTSTPTITFSDVTSPMVRATATLTVQNGMVTGINWSNRGNYKPTITIQAATNGGTTATATATIDSRGRVVSTSITNAGNYLPTLTFSAPYGDGTTATATCTLDSQGGIAAVSVTSGGTKYLSVPTITIQRKYSNTQSYPNADLLIHLGTETDKCIKWDGTTLAGKWVTRVVEDVGNPLSSIEVISGGAGYSTPTPTTPTIYIAPPSQIAVTISAPPTGGTQATAYANVHSSGYIFTITVTNQGSGYTSAPTVTVLAPGTGGTQSTGWTANLTAGKVTSITGGTTGDYSIAATAVMSGGSIASINLTKAGAGFKTAPSIVLNSTKGNVFLVAHFGTETEYADGSQVPGSLPLGYVDTDYRTYPILGTSGTAPWKYYSLAVPNSNGTTLVGNIRAVCDCSSCP